MSSRIQGIAISGPKSRDLLQRICRGDMSSNAFKFRDVRQLFVGDVPAMLIHLSFSGETGYEIYVAPEYLIRLYEALFEAGTELALTPYGAEALMSLRLEKYRGVWTLDFRPDYTVAESGLDVFIQWDKKFIGRQAALEERIHGPTKKLVTLIIDTQNIDVSGDEAIL